ncbi:MAG: hypothetical protein WC465_04225 [Patescibacteria group bacterium]
MNKHSVLKIKKIVNSDKKKNSAAEADRAGRVANTAVTETDGGGDGSERAQV